MTTTTSTTTASSAIGTATQQLLTSLDTGSGVDTSSLVTSLVQAQFAAQTTALTTKTSTLTAQISGVGTLKSAITGFASALETLVKGGTLTTQPTSSNTAAITATALPGAKLAGLSSTIGVTQLASAQSVSSAAISGGRTATIGTGVLKLTLGTATYSSDGSQMTGFTAGAGAPVSITIDSGNATLDGIAGAINAQKARVTASIVTDANGDAYLSLKGATGAAQAFTLEATTDDSGNLAKLAVGPTGSAGTASSGMTLTGVAQNAKVKVDGVAVERASNTISDLIDGVKLQLTGVTTTAAPVTLSSTTPTAGLSQAVSDFVETYNQVLASITAQTDPITGPLRADPAAKSLLRSLKSLTSTALLTGGATGTPATLGEIGVATNRDGTLKVNTSTLTSALANYPDAIESMFAFSSDATSGISAILNTISTTAIDKTYGLGASETRYTAYQSDAAAAQDKITDQSATLTTRLTKQFADMNSKVAAYKSTQAFLKNQIDAWNNKDS